MCEEAVCGRCHLVESAHGFRVVAGRGPGFYSSMPEPILGPPAARTRPFYLWGQFPGFILPTSAPVKVKTGAMGHARNKKNGEAVWANRRMWNGKQRERAAEIAEIPAALAVPFAKACADALTATCTTGSGGTP